MVSIKSHADLLVLSPCLQQGWVGSRPGGYEAEAEVITVIEAETEAEASDFDLKFRKPKPNPIASESTYQLEAEAKTEASGFHSWKEGSQSHCLRAFKPKPKQNTKLRLKPNVATIHIREAKSQLRRIKQHVPNT